MILGRCRLLLLCQALFLATSSYLLLLHLLDQVEMQEPMAMVTREQDGLELLPEELDWKEKSESEGELGERLVLRRSRNRARMEEVLLSHGFQDM